MPVKAKKRLATARRPRNTRVSRAPTAVRVLAPPQILVLETEAQGPVQPVRLLELLGELLCAEQASHDLCLQTLERSHDIEIRSRLREFLAETRMHVDQLETAIRDLGGNPVEPGPVGELELVRAEALLAMRPPQVVRELAGIENILSALSRCHRYWRLLARARKLIEDPHARDLVARLAGTIESEKAEHVHWARRTLDRLRLEWLIEPAERSQAA
jgi:hypothetical protein